MKKNLGTADKIIRVFLFIFFATLYFTQLVTGTLGITLLVVGVVLLLTSLINWCPIYAILGIKTCKV